MGAGEPATTSSSAANDNYLGHRLAFGPVDEKLAGIATPRMVAAFFKKAFLVWLITLAVSLFLIAFFFLIARERGLGAGLRISGLLYLLSFAVFFITFRAPASGWYFTLDDKAAAAESAFAQVYTALRRRESPVETKPVQIKGGFDRSPRNYLRLHHGQFSAYVSVFPIGRDLFLGWTIWWEVKPLRMIWTFLNSQFGPRYFQLVVRSDDAQAFREIVHNATREGVDIANLGIQVPMATAFGSEIPFETESAPG
ncbi:MAG: hypothetical protein ACRDJG_13295 [Actinomycetota bacterium]